MVGTHIRKNADPPYHANPTVERHVTCKLSCSYTFLVAPFSCLYPRWMIYPKICYKHSWISVTTHNLKLGGGLKYFLFSPLLREDYPVDEYFSDGLVQPPTRKTLVRRCCPSIWQKKHTSTRYLCYERRWANWHRSVVRTGSFYSRQQKTKWVFGVFRKDLGGGFKYFVFSSLFGGRFPFLLIFFKGVETTN